MDAAVIQRIIAYRRALLVTDAAARRRADYCIDTLIARAADTPDAEHVLRNFLAHFTAVAA
jgi:hypothetical protein